MFREHLLLPIQQAALSLLGQDTGRSQISNKKTRRGNDRERTAALMSKSVIETGRAGEGEEKCTSEVNKAGARVPAELKESIHFVPKARAPAIANSVPMCGWMPGLTNNMDFPKEEKEEGGDTQEKGSDNSDVKTGNCVCQVFKLRQTTRRENASVRYNVLPGKRREDDTTLSRIQRMPAWKADRKKEACLSNLLLE